jgi:hypothetical protein
MDGGFHTVVHFQVKLGKLVFLVSRGLLDITKRRGIHNVADDKALDGFILRNGLSRGHTSDTLDVTAAVLVPSVIASLNSHDALELLKKGQK